MNRLQQNLLGRFAQVIAVDGGTYRCCCPVCRDPEGILLQIGLDAGIGCRHRCSLDSIVSQIGLSRQEAIRILTMTQFCDGGDGDAPFTLQE